MVNDPGGSETSRGRRSLGLAWKIHHWKGSQPTRPRCRAREAGREHQGVMLHKEKRGV